MQPYKVTSVTVLQVLSGALLQQAQNRLAAFHPLHLPRVHHPLHARLSPHLTQVGQAPAGLQVVVPLAVAVAAAVVVAGNS